MADAGEKVYRVLMKGGRSIDFKASSMNTSGDGLIGFDSAGVGHIAFVSIAEIEMVIVVSALVGSGGGQTP